MKADATSLDKTPAQTTSGRWILELMSVDFDGVMEVAEIWYERAAELGFSDPFPSTDSKVQLADFADRCRLHFLNHYIGKLPEALRKFETGCLSFQRCKEILADNGIELGLLADIEGLCEQLSQQLADAYEKCLDQWQQKA